jgi:hypothetical protein
VLVIVLAGYPLSIGPAIWLDGHGYLPDWSITAVSAFYAPLNWEGIPEPIVDALSWYAGHWEPALQVFGPATIR